MIEPVLNELSFEIAAIDIHTARHWMEGFVHSLIPAIRLGLKRTLRCSFDLQSHYLTKEYPVSRWRNDPDVDKDVREYFRLLSTKYPIHVDVEHIAEHFQELD